MTNDLTQTNTNLPKYRKVTDLPEELRFYTIVMNTKTKFFNISGDIIEKIMKSETNFIRLKSGDIINKAFIGEILWDKEETINHYRKQNEPY